MVISGFFANVFLFALKKMDETALFFSKVKGEKISTKKKKKTSESLENCTTCDAWIFYAHFSLLFFLMKNKFKQSPRKMLDCLLPAV